LTVSRALTIDQIALVFSSSAWMKNCSGLALNLDQSTSADRIPGLVQFVAVDAVEYPDPVLEYPAQAHGGFQIQRIIQGRFNRRAVGKNLNFQQAVVVEDKISHPQSLLRFGHRRPQGVTCFWHLHHSCVDQILTPVTASSLASRLAGLRFIAPASSSIRSFIFG